MFLQVMAALDVKICRRIVGTELQDASKGRDTFIPPGLLVPFQTFMKAPDIFFVFRRVLLLADQFIDLDGRESTSRQNISSLTTS